VKTKQGHRHPAVDRVLHGLRTLPVLRSYPTLYVGSAMRSRRHRADFTSVQTYVLFVGHPRSGHSLVGSLLDAHPDVVVSHELDALKYVAVGYHRDQLFTLVLEHAKANAAAGRKSWGYSYAVPGQWQGGYQRLSVIGDKRGRKSTARLAADLGLLDRLASTVRVPVSVVQVVRNPFDNIATMWRRGTKPLDDQVVEYFALADTVDRIVARVDPDRFHRLRLEDLVAAPQQHLDELCRFVGVEPDRAYLDSCASIVFQSPRKTRDDAPWSPELKRDVERRAGEHEWLATYLGAEHEERT
jgi:hypothetical protein